MTKEAMKLAQKWQQTDWNTENPMSADFAVSEAHDVISALIDALREALADQPAQQQEPVAWRVFDKDPFDGRDHRWVYFDKSEFVDGVDPTTHFNLEPVYTSPPAQRKPLTDMQVDGEWILVRDLDTNDVEKSRLFARAIEAAHGIKENT